MTFVKRLRPRAFAPISTELPSDCVMLVSPFLRTMPVFRWPEPPASVASLIHGIIAISAENTEEIHRVSSTRSSISVVESLSSHCTSIMSSQSIDLTLGQIVTPTTPVVARSTTAPADDFITPPPVTQLPDIIPRAPIRTKFIAADVCFNSTAPSPPVSSAPEAASRSDREIARSIFGASFAVDGGLNSPPKRRVSGAIEPASVIQNKRPLSPVDIGNGSVQIDASSEYHANTRQRTENPQIHATTSLPTELQL